MDRRDLLKGGVTLAGISVLTPSTLLIKDCNPEDVLSNTRKVIRALNDVVPFFEQLPNGTTFVIKIHDAITIAEKFISAVEGKVIGNAVQLATALIAAFQVIATDTKLFPIPVQVTVLAILGIANVALHYIVDWADTQAKKNPTSVPSGVETLEVNSFKTEKVWGKLLHN